MEGFSISLGDILDYVGDKKRCLKEGEAVVNARHLLAVGVVARNPAEVTIKAFCAQSAHIRDKPHEILLHMTMNKFSVKCSCKAGLSEQCKHCVALIIFVNR